MNKYRVCVPIYASVWVEVEAETEDEALTKGYENCWPSLCHQCSNEIDLGEIDDSQKAPVYLDEES